MHILAAAAVAAQVASAAAGSESTNTGVSADETIIVTGTRFSGLRASKSTEPVQVVSSGELQTAGPPALADALTTLVPSFTTQAVGNDLANETLAARLRGLSPNHTLILVNGKRRHGPPTSRSCRARFRAALPPTSPSSRLRRSSGSKCCLTAPRRNTAPTPLPG